MANSVVCSEVGVGCCGGGGWVENMFPRILDHHDLSSTGGGENVSDGEIRDNTSFRKPE